MAYLNAPVPVITCLVRGNFLRNQEDSFEKKYPALIFGVSSIPGYAPLFHFVNEDGGLWWRMPIHAFCWKEEAEEQELDELVLWDSYSYHVSVTQFPWLKNKKMSFTSRRKNKYCGRYLFTLDWAEADEQYTNSSISEDPGHHKCGHVIELDNGNYAIQPNNRVIVHEPAFSVKQGEQILDRKFNTHIWTAEGSEKWMTEDTDSSHSYEFKPNKPKGIGPKSK